MCNRYSTPEIAEVERFWHIGRGSQPMRPGPLEIFPLAVGPIIRGDDAVTWAQWGMIPAKSKTRRPMTSTGRPMSTNNARREGVAKSWTFGWAWSHGQRCLIPASAFDEPYWGTGKNIWWRFRRADGTPWALAGLWNEWTDPETAEIVTSYTMLTQNCDGHPLLALMHKPDPKLPPDQQDKRAVVPIEPADWETWLHGTVEQAEALIRVPPVEIFAHGPADPAVEAVLLV